MPRAVFLFPLVVLIYYCYIESWTLAYVFHSIVGTFRTTDPKTFFREKLVEGVATIAALKSGEIDIVALDGESLVFAGERDVLVHEQQLAGQGAVVQRDAQRPHVAWGGLDPDRPE